MDAGPYVWRWEQTTLYLQPEEALTWVRWLVVPLVIRMVVMQNEYRGTQFVLLWQDVGPVGYGHLIAAGTQATSSSSVASLTVRAIPDPTARHFDSIGLTIEYYGYRGSVSSQALRACVKLASKDAVAHLRQSADPMRMSATQYTYSARGVLLALNPRETLTWHMWAFVPVWIQEFVKENELKGTQFNLSYVGYGIVASGRLVGMVSGGLPGPRVDTA